MAPREVRLRKAHKKSRGGCAECKSKHHKCDETKPICGNCQRKGLLCSLSHPSSPSEGSNGGTEALAVDDLRLLHHWCRGIGNEDFMPFEDHKHLEEKGGKDREMDLAFDHPFLLRTILALSALHIYHQDPTNMRPYSQALKHYAIALREASPFIAACNEQDSDAVFRFAGLASLYATAEPALRPHDDEDSGQEDHITSMIQSFRMSKGVLTVIAPHLAHLEQSGSLDRKRWADNRDELKQTLELDFPEIIRLRSLIVEQDSTYSKSYLDAAELVFISISVLAHNPKNHSSLRLIQTWSTAIDPILIELMEAQDPLSLVILAHFAVMMYMRRNYWFFRRWPPLLLRSIEGKLDVAWNEYVSWPKSVIYGGLDLQIVPKGD